MTSPYHKFAYFEDNFIDFVDAKINVMTHAFLYGSACFEGIRAYWNAEKNKLFLLQARPHLQRIMNSCKILRIKPHYTVDEMLSLTIDLMKHNKPMNDVYIRPSWYKAIMRIGPTLINPNSDVREDQFVLTSLDLGDYLDMSKGLSVCVSSWNRLDDNAIPPRAKINGSYVNTGMAKSDAILAGFDDAIFMTRDGYVSEGSAMNLFMVRDDKLVTPRCTDNILEGITRALIIKIAKEDLNIEVEERNIQRTELYCADELFFAGTGAKLAPIGCVDHREIGNGQIGEITKQLLDIYQSICIGNNGKYSDEVIEISY